MGGMDMFLAPMSEVLTATRLAQRQQDAPASIFVIDRDMLEASGVVELADLMRLVPGYLVASDGNNQRIVGYHGLIDDYGRRMQVLIDGRSVYDPFRGGVRWADLPISLDDIQRIEVIRGSNSASYGANAFLGVINIITLTPAESQGVYVRAAAGDPNYSQGVLRHGLRSGPIDLRYTVDYAEDAGFTWSPDRTISDAKELTLVAFDFSYTRDQANQFRLQVGSKQGQLETGSVNRVEDPARFADTAHRFAQFEWDHQRTRDERFQLLAYYNYNSYRDAFDLVVPLDTDLVLYSRFDNGYTAERYAIELQQHLRMNERLRLVWGGELREERVTSASYFRTSNPARNSMQRVFGNLEWRFAESTVLNAGAMLEHHDLSGTDLSPRVGLNWQVNPRHALRVSAARAVRVPSLWENQADHYHEVDIGTPARDGGIDAIFQPLRIIDSQQRESTESLELGWLFDFGPEIGLTGDVKLFYDRYHDLIFEYHYPMLLRGDLAACDPVQNPFVETLLPPIADALEWGGKPSKWSQAPTCNLFTGFSTQIGLEGPETLSFANQVSLDIYGVEASLEYRPGPRSRLLFNYSIVRQRNLSFANPALLDRTFNDLDEKIAVGSPRPTDSWLGKIENDLGQSVPAHIMSSMAIYRPRNDLTLSAMLYYQDRLIYLETGDDNLDDFLRLDLRAAWRFRVGGWRGELYGVVQNVTADYADFENKNVFRTRTFAGINLRQ